MNAGTNFLITIYNLFLSKTIQKVAGKSPQTQSKGHFWDIFSQP